MGLENDILFRNRMNNKMVEQQSKYLFLCIICFCICCSTLFVCIVQITLMYILPEKIKYLSIKRVNNNKALRLLKRRSFTYSSLKNDPFKRVLKSCEAYSVSFETKLDSYIKLSKSQG